ncbi:phage tail protein [Methyloraptor flagellatus]|jgi:microcystin-dependent protein|uniref:Tail fiber protein n=1 Tax=Methyloraptor flagellatus TaxID=3162530 RepID=A0AAU7XDY1_9HYPH
METYVGQILLFAFPRVPTGWHLCDGSLLPIAQYDTLFALIGTTYGGDGQVTFALPDLRGRVPLHQGQQPGRPMFVLGEESGTEDVTLLISNLPSHGHAVAASTANPPSGPSPTPGSDVGFATTAGGVTAYAPNATGALPRILAQQTVWMSGGNVPHNNMMPSLVMNYCISLYGVYPTPP